MPLRSAQTAEVMRSGQKDGYTLQHIAFPLVKRCVDCCSKFLSVLNQDVNAGLPQSQQIPQWLRYMKEVETLSTLLYFSLTTMLGYQTLGEEYVSIVQVDSTRKYHPQWLIRGLMVCSHCLTPYIVLKIVQKLQFEVEKSDSIVPNGKQYVLDILGALGSITSWIYKLHRSIFFLWGSHENIAKMFFNITYVSVRRGLPPRFAGFQVLGLIGIIEALVTLAKALVRHRRFLQQSTIKAITPVKKAECITRKGNRCPLCYELFRDITSTLCGHLYCWGCIYTWCSTKPMCPICREPSDPSKLILLVNYNVHN